MPCRSAGSWGPPCSTRSSIRYGAPSRPRSMSNCAPGRKARRARRWKTSSLEGPPPAASSGERRVGGVPQPFGAVRAPGGERDRKSVVEGKSVEDRVESGGRRLLKKKNKKDI